MKYFFHIILILGWMTSLFFPLASQAQDSTITIRGFVFQVSDISLGIEETIGNQGIALGRKDGNILKPLLKHIILGGQGDCNSESWEIGSWEVQDTLILFYSKWIKAGDAPASPIGVRKQVYRVTAEGKVLPLTAVCWIEEGSMSPIAEEADWIWHSDKTGSWTHEEKNSWKIYRDWILKEYHATLVTHSEKKELIKEVSKALKESVDSVTDSWDEIYGHHNGFGVYK